jgi:hypothetical protein
MSKAARLKAARRAVAAAEQKAQEFASADFSRKLDRALTHIDALRVSIGEWLNSNAYALVEETEAETGYQVVVPKITEEPGDEWPLLIGDAVHNMRSALDHLVYALAVKGYQATHTGGVPADTQKRLMFPILTASPDPKRTVEKYFADTAKIQLQYVPTSAVARIQRLQPYECSAAAPFADALAVINELDIIDKHRRLNTLAIAPPLQGMQIGGGDVEIELLEMIGGPIMHDRPIMRYSIRAIGTTPVHMHRQFARAIALGDGPPAAQGREVVGLLREMREYVLSSVLSQFAEFF